MPSGAILGRLFRTGCKHHLLVDATGIPLPVALIGGNRNDVTQLLPLLDDLHARPGRRKVGRPRQKSDRRSSQLSDVQRGDLTGSLTSAGGESRGSSSKHPA